MTNTKSIGDRAEAKVLSACIERDWTVSVPFGDNARYDLIVDTSDRGLLRVQVKTASRSPETERAITAALTSNSWGAKDKSKKHPYSVEEIDAFALYFPGCMEWNESERVMFLEAGKPLQVKDGFFQQTISLVLPSFTGRETKSTEYAKKFTLAAWPEVLDHLMPLNQKVARLKRVA